jgi:BolA protein
MTVISSQTISQRLTEALNPVSLTVEDVSHTHASHNPQAAAGNTHFTVTIVAPVFAGKSLVERHRMVYAALGELMPKIHALALTAKSPEEI